MDAVTHRLDGDMVTVVLTGKDGKVVRIVQHRKYAELTVAHAKTQPWFAKAEIEEADSKPDVT